MTPDTTPATWILDAIASGDRFDRIGDRHLSVTHPGEPVFRVSATEVPRDDPRGNFWGWLEPDGNGVPAGPPCMIRRGWPEFSKQFTYGPEAAQKAGKGVIVRLDVRAAAAAEGARP